MKCSTGNGIKSFCVLPAAAASLSQTLVLLSWATAINLSTPVIS